MSGAAGHILWVAAGALLGGALGAALAPGLFWAALLGGAMTLGAVRVGYILMTADDAEQD